MTDAQRVSPIDPGVRVVIADAVWALIDAEIIPKTPQIIERSAQVTRITLGDLRDASYRAERGVPPRGRIPLRSLEDPEPKATATVTPLRRPDPHKEVCLACHKLRGVSKFRVVNESTGRRSHVCGPCEQQRTRFLEATAAAGAAAHLSFEVLTADNLDMACPVCEKKFRAGDQVECRTLLRHKGCLG